MTLTMIRIMILKAPSLITMIMIHDHHHEVEDKEEAMRMLA